MFICDDETKMTLKINSETEKKVHALMKQMDGTFIEFVKGRKNVPSLVMNCCCGRQNERITIEHFLESGFCEQCRKIITMAKKDEILNGRYHEHLLREAEKNDCNILTKITKTTLWKKDDKISYVCGCGEESTTSVKKLLEGWECRECIKNVISRNKFDKKNYYQDSLEVANKQGCEIKTKKYAKKKDDTFVFANIKNSITYTCSCGRPGATSSIEIFLGGGLCRSCQQKDDYQRVSKISKNPDKGMCKDCKKTRATFGPMDETGHIKYLYCKKCSTDHPGCGRSTTQSKSITYCPFIINGLKCGVQGSYAYSPWDPHYCSRHVGFIDIHMPHAYKNKLCECGKYASIGESDSTERKWCKDCVPTEFRTVTKTNNERLCVECKKEDVHKVACFGILNGPIIHCKKHRTKDDVDIVHASCSEKDCEATAIYYNKNNPLKSLEFCVNHKPRGTQYLSCRSTYCETCQDVQVRTKGDKCSECDPENSYEKKEEKKLIELFRREGLMDDCIYNRTIITSKGRYRPDFLWRSDKVTTIVECDENCHCGYDDLIETERMEEIAKSETNPCIFIRYNPNNYKINGRNNRIPEQKRHEKLIGKIRECFIKESVEGFEIEYMFYNK